jgi:methyl-accepting chemotaxis protein
MTNSSSLSKAIVALSAAFACLLANGLSVVLVDGYGGAGFALGLLPVFAAMMVSVHRFRRAVAILTRIADVCGAAAAGQLEARIVGAPEPGLIGSIQRRVNIMLDITDAFLREASGSATYVSRRKYFRKVLPQGLPGAFGMTARTLNDATVTMENSVNEFVTFAKDDVGDVVKATSQAADELARSVGDIDTQIRLSARMADEAAREALRTETTVNSLGEAARSIGTIAEMINTVSRKTNLLALNATIEASRAGEAGRGFAVVAAQVTDLASQKARATDEVYTHVLEIQSVARDAGQLIANIGTMVQRINENAAALAAVTQVSASAVELGAQAENLGAQVATFIDKVHGR